MRPPDPALVRRSFMAFHLVLGVGLLVLSLRTLIHAVAPENLHSHQHFAIVGGEWRPDLAIYAVGAWFVFVHGSEWLRRSPSAPS